jgi:hypothetical protein
MLFLSPLALLGLLAALVPPLLHLFQRRHPPEFVFPAVQYLRQTEREAERTLKLRHLLLMLLRVAAVVLIVLAAARPVVPRVVPGGGSLHEPTALAIVLDHSLSSGAIAGGRRVLDELTLRARETLRDAQAGDALWIVGADGLPRRGTATELIAMVSALTPSARRLDLAAAVGAAARVVSGAGFARTEIHVLSDFQGSAIGERERLERLGGLGRLERLERLDSAAGGIAVLVYHPSAPPPPNRAVTLARPRPPLWLAGSGAVAVRVGGGPRAGGRVPVALALEGRAGGRALADSGDVVLAAPGAGPGWRTGEVALEADELRADDRRWFAVRVVPPSAVELDAAFDAGAFVREAVTTLVEARQVRAGGGAGAVRVGGPAGRRPAVVFPPADPAQAGALNRMLDAAGVSWRFAARLEREDSIVAPTVPELDGARVRARWRLEAPGGASGAGSAGGGDGGAVLARAGADPWLVRDGSVVLVGTRMVPEETNLPLSGGFVPFVSALVNRLVRGEAGILEAAPGASVTLPGLATGLAGGDSVRRVEGGGVIAAPEVPGVFAIVAGPDTAGMLVVAPDARESDLTRGTAAQLQARLPGARVTVTADPARYAAERFRGAGRSELTGLMLLLAMVVLLAEGLVATGRLGRAA